MEFPGMDEARKEYSYTDIFAFFALWNIGLVAIVLLGLFILALIWKTYLIRKTTQHTLQESILTSEERQSRSELNPLIEQPKTNPNTKLFKTINILTSILFYLFWFVVALAHLVLYSFQFFGRSIGIDVLIVFALTLILALPTLVWKSVTKVKPASQMRKEIIAGALLLCLWLSLCVFLVIAAKGMCVCAFTDKYGFKIYSDFKISTGFMRQMQIDTICEDKAVCHVYATLPQQSDTQVFINIHTGLGLKKVEVQLNSAGSNASLTSQDIFEMTNVESIGQRNIHSILFSNLQPNTLYNISIVEFNTTKVLYSHKYKTLPAGDSSLLKMAIGGDVGLTKDSDVLTTFLKPYNPDVIILGGDTVYDDGMRNCYYSWDLLYFMFEDLYDSLGRIVPIVMTVGNHDVGFDALASVGVSKEPIDAPLFLVFHPQHLNSKGLIPPLNQRKTYHSHKIGPTVHFSLDSGYAQSYSAQVPFLEQGLAAVNKYYKFMNYHNPIYPSCTDSTPGSNDDLIIQNATKYWTPLFDKFNVVAGMEHHTHHRKFTKMIKNSTAGPVGVRYLGDGSWGVKEEICSMGHVTKFPQRFEQFQTERPNHIWLVTVKNEASPSINYTWIDLYNNTRSYIDPLAAL